MTVAQNKDRLYVEQISQLQKQALVGVIATLANSLILILILRKVVAFPSLTIWFLILLCLSVLRWFHFRTFPPLQAPVAEVKRWARWFVTGMAASGTVWGAAGIFLLPENSVIHQAFLTFVLGGMVAGAAGSFSVRMSGYHAFSLPALLPVSVRLMLIGDEVRFAMGGMVFLFMILMGFIARNLNRKTQEMFNVKFENTDLIAGLEKAKEDADRINKELKLEIAEREKADEELRKHRQHLSDMVEDRTAELNRTNQELSQALERLQGTQAQLIHTEKMASIGQLAAGIAHEINNPTGYVSSNLVTLTEYEAGVERLIREYKKLCADLQDLRETEAPAPIKKRLEQISAIEAEIDLDYILNDTSELIKETLEGTDRIKVIVASLKDFAHPGENKLELSDINRGIESTLVIVWNELKYKATVSKEYGDLPLVKCIPHEINQVFMNLLVNAAQAIEKQGEIKIVTQAVDGAVEIEISDTGKGIPRENLSKIFDPFFTTKEIGKGTGLGLHLSQTIVEKHHGTLSVESTEGKGTTFTVRLPIGEKDA